TGYQVDFILPGTSPFVPSTIAFVARFDPVHPGPRLAGMTILGDPTSGDGNRTVATAIAVDPADNVYLTGYTNCLHFPRANAYPGIPVSPRTACLMKFNPAIGLNLPVYSHSLAATTRQTPWPSTPPATFFSPGPPKAPISPSPTFNRTSRTAD